MVFSDLALWRHHSWSVTSREREVLASWRHISQLFLHAHIGTKAIFTNDYNMTVWILAGNYISFTIAAGLIRLHMPGVKKYHV